MTLETWLLTVYPLLLNRTMTRVENVLANGDRVTAYWAGAIIRIDIKPA